ncbi:helix-turn-helix transcriptional regulator [Edaphosphingomonas haloaromaticamans]|uniref:AraC family transcriptional regulator n=3 Tax=Edaphosphingomonas TaxID=3423724 RepID=A0A2T4I4N8_9SPHN|nr:MULTISPECIES: AraC family transcriptional regulator [Sphingomonas]MDX3882862.1 AraC family transcriptional regulator [Sphingomonas sp.]OHT20283.1 Regulatory protein SoxS [Sphingomonas haloaromaticamans]PTD24490.1 AraC family transcriptional regulator [Sphingomonas fennica]
MHKDQAGAIEQHFAVGDFRLDVLSQPDTGPFTRTHLVDYPSIAYLPTGQGEDPVRGCFGEPRSHRSFVPFGAAVLVPANLAVHVQSTGYAERRLLICRFDPDIFESLTGLGANASGDELAACIDVRDAAVLATLERLSIAVSRPSTAREMLVRGLGMVLLAELTRHFELVRERGFHRAGTLAPWQLKRIDQRLADESKPVPSVSELASLCGIGRRHLMRAFKATRGSTVMEHVERTLFARAARMLGETTIPVKSLAVSLGYERQGSFSAAFRRRFGETPRDYRARASAGR